MSFKNIHSVYFLGIGGIGMSALARWFHKESYAVAGYDKTPSPLTDELIAEGIEISFEDHSETIPQSFLTDKSKVMVVWTPAVPKESRLLCFFQEEQFDLKKRSEILGMLTENHYSIAVAGTHGKTTTSSLIAHIFKASGRSMVAFLGGITQNYQTNLVLNQQKGEPVMVVEADEFDRSFLRLNPNESVITSVDADHLDIYGDEDHLLDGFKEFIKKLKKKGRLYIQQNAAQKLGSEALPSKRLTIYGLRSEGVHADNIQARPGSFVFDFISPKVIIKGLELFIPGFHNVENALVAISIALSNDIEPDQIREALSTFKGVKRRFEIHVNEGGKIFIDDYAHHPEEIRAFLSSVRAMFPTKHLTVVFQPHLFTRTRDFAPQFSESLSLADEVILLEIYPARELPIPGVNSSMLLDGIQSQAKQVIEKTALMELLKARDPELLVTIGAGDIDRLVPDIAAWTRSRTNLNEA
ncbi:UDP-N-acetylmuramate--L-alanine ligase [Algoriphagus hitonicola]|nr:UDP-N-acetylmuramate--L-alanine ligase [Algoriphagus hitonicola]